MSDLALSPFAPGSRRLRLPEPLRRLMRDWSDHYRPELHYMRGPGPKWREKHAPKPAAPELTPGEPR
jgi:hypothetical protein